MNICGTDSDLAIRLVVAKGERGEEAGWTGIWWLVDANYYIKWVYNQAVWYSTGNYIQSPGISHMVFVYAQSSLTHIVSHIDHTLWSYGLWPTWFLCP